jgi:hypothetical protein
LSFKEPIEPLLKPLSNVKDRNPTESPLEMLLQAACAAVRSLCTPDDPREAASGAFRHAQVNVYITAPKSLPINTYHYFVLVADADAEQAGRGGHAAGGGARRGAGGHRGGGTPSRWCLERYTACYCVISASGSDACITKWLATLALTPITLYASAGGRCSARARRHAVHGAQTCGGQRGGALVASQRPFCIRC